MAELKERCEIEDKYKWDLSTLYVSDEAWQQALDATTSFDEKIKEFEGKLNNAETILEFCKFSTEVSRTLSNIYNYASLRHSEDSRDATSSSMSARALSRYVAVSSALSFAEPEILSLPQDKLDEIISDERLAEYSFYLKDMVRAKSHTLTAKEEKIISTFGEALSASSEAAEALMDADLVYDDIVDGNGQTHQLSDSLFIPYQMSDDRVLRENAFRSYYKTYKQHTHTFASTYAGTVKAATAEAMLRNYNSSREMSLSANNIPVSVYDNLVETVHKHMDLMYRYVALRKKILGIEDLHYYDVYAPLSKGSSKTYDFQTAKEMVLEAVKPLGKEYVERVKMAYNDGWIDVYPNNGKRGGAFSSGTYDSNPFILLNFTGTLDSVSTLAHEMGHSQHTWLTNHNQPAQYADYSLFVAEVASTVNENLLIDQLLKNCDEPKERLALLNEYLEGFKGTVYRQTMFAEFEMIAHKMKEEGQSLDADALAKVYEDLIKLYFGPELIVDDEVKYEWSRIPHFYSPFYVYVYATGYTSAVALSQGILNDGKQAVDKYLEFLSMGGSKYPLDELKHAGVDLNSPEPIERALKKFEAILDDAEATFERIK